jgi:hypothetical protein
MSPKQKEQMQEFLRKEGCPETALNTLSKWIDEHPEATIGQANGRLNVIVSDIYGHPSYKSFMERGFRPIVRDHLLMGREVPALV